MRDRQHPPFSVGTSISLQGISPEAATPLTAGLVQALASLPSAQRAHAESIISCILHWTSGQPFLTQKLCQLTVEQWTNQPGQPGQEKAWIDALVQQQILHHWESQDEPKHLSNIRDRLLRHKALTPLVLNLYRQLLLGQPIASSDSRAQLELFFAGLVTRGQNQLQPKNRIYTQIFNLAWVDQQLAM